MILLSLLIIYPRSHRLKMNSKQIYGSISLKLLKCMTNHISIWVHRHHLPVTFKIAFNCHQHHNDSATTTAKKKRIFAFPNALGRGQPFPRLFLDLCMGDEPVSSTSCRSGALIVSYLCMGNDCPDAIGYLVSMAF